jgi:deoxycytidylate deaminase
MEILKPGTPETERVIEAKKLLRSTGLLDITEFGRAVHAEMDALLTCLRSGVSPLT